MKISIPFFIMSFMFAAALLLLGLFLYSTGIAIFLICTMLAATAPFLVLFLGSRAIGYFCERNRNAFSVGNGVLAPSHAEDIKSAVFFDPDVRHNRVEYIYSLIVAGSIGAVLGWGYGHFISMVLLYIPNHLGLMLLQVMFVEEVCFIIGGAVTAIVFQKARLDRKLALGDQGLKDHNPGLWKIKIIANAILFTLVIVVPMGLFLFKNYKDEMAYKAREKKEREELEKCEKYGQCKPAEYEPYYKNEKHQEHEEPAADQPSVHSFPTVPAQDTIFELSCSGSGVEGVDGQVKEIGSCSYKNYEINIVSEPPGVKIEWNNEYIGKTPCKKVLNGSYSYSDPVVIVATPVSSGQVVQRSVPSEKPLPKIISFNMNSKPSSSSELK